MKKIERRRTFFVEDSIQGKYLFSYLVVAALVMVFFTLLFIYFSTDTLTIAYDGNHKANIGKTPEIMMKSIFIIHGILIFVCGLAILYVVPRFTHRTAGPILKIEKTLDLMIHGDFSRTIFLRKNDEYWELAEKVNRLNGVMRNRILEIQRLANELDVHLEKLDKTGLAGQTQNSLDALEAINRQLNQCLSCFRLSETAPEYHV